MCARPCARPCINMHGDGKNGSEYYLKLYMYYMCAKIRKFCNKSKNKDKFGGRAERAALPTSPPDTGLA